MTFFFSILTSTRGYIYLWDGSQTYGDFTSDQGTLTFPVDLPADDVKLFVVSQQPLGLDADGALIRQFALFQNYPNPFNPSTTIRFNLPTATQVELAVYDILGREVVRLVDRHLGLGYHAATWNGRTAAGREVPSGVYIARLVILSTAGVTPAYVKSIKIVLLK